MGVTVQAESHRCELAFVYTLEHDPEVIGYWDQPEPFKITYESAHGRPTSPMITVDYLVLRSDRLELIEVKPAEAMPELAKDKPNRFSLGDDGKWHSPPAEAAACEFGIGFRIWTPTECDPTWLTNIKFLQDYFSADLQLVPVEVRKQLDEIVSGEFGLTLADLRERCPAATPDHVNSLIAHERIFADLTAALLTDASRVRLFTCREAADTFGSLHKTPLPGIAGNGATSDSSAAGETKLGVAAFALLRGAGPEDHAVANHRLRTLFDSNHAKNHPVPNRTIRRWRKLFHAAEARYGSGLLGLFPRFKARGNRCQRYPDEFLTLVDQTIEAVYCTPTRPNKRHAYDQLRLACENRFSPPSRSWFYRRLEKRSKFEDTLSRQGKRAAHKFEYYRPGEPNENHGAYPWDVCQTDHTQCDVELVCSQTGENLGRPWLSILIDGYSRRIFAFCLTFDPPSYRTLMLLVRDCVKRHNRLPGCLVVDGGKEFQSGYFETLTGFYGVIVKRRPPGKARFGSIVERMFGTINSQFFHALPGNTQNIRSVRQMTKSMNPKGHAIYTLEELHAMLSAFAFEIYEGKPHPALNCSPAQKFAAGVEIAGGRAHKAVEDDEAFRLMTLPTTPKGTAKIQPGMGLKIFGFYYWANEMRSQHYEGKSVRVKYDPEDLGVAWAYLGEQWVQCRPSRTVNLEGRTEKELKLATLECRRSAQGLGRRQSDSQRRLADLLRTATQNKALQLQKARDRALRNTRLTPAETDRHPTAPPIAENSAPDPAAAPPPILAIQDYGNL